MLSAVQPPKPHWFCPINKQRVLLIVLLSSASFAYYWHKKLDSVLHRQPALTAFSRVPDARFVSLVGLGYDQPLADIFWLNYISYVGDTAAHLKDHYRDSYSYLSLITSLDPNFTQSYWFCAFSVGADQGRPDLARQILDSGIARNPDNWYLPYIAGLNEYLFAHDEVAASRYYRMAARFPDAPHWLSRQADVLEMKIPSAIKEIRTWETVYRSNEAPPVRARAKEALIKLWLKVFHSTSVKQIKDQARRALTDLDYELN